MSFLTFVVKKYNPNSTKRVYEDGENLLNRDFSTTKINEKWVADITYIHTQKIVGYSFSKTMDTSLVLRALNNAITTQKPSKGQIIHSDRGSQYTSKEYRKAVETKEFRLSYSAKGCRYDNACIESYHAILKKEFVYLNTFIDYKHASIVLFQYIEGFYNRKRIHSSINYMSPDAYENLCRVS